MQSVCVHAFWTSSHHGEGTLARKASLAWKTEFCLSFNSLPLLMGMSICCYKLKSFPLPSCLTPTENCLLFFFTRQGLILMHSCLQKSQVCLQGFLTLVFILSNTIKQMTGQEAEALHCTGIWILNKMQYLEFSILHLFNFMVTVCCRELGTAFLL